MVNGQPEQEKPLKDLTPRERDEKEQYEEKIEKISREMEQEGELNEGFEPIAKPPENTIEVTNREEIGISQEKIEYLYSHLNEMTLTNLRTELQDVSKNYRGTKKELRDRLRKFYREQFAAIKQRHDAVRSRIRARPKFRYLVAIDIEATCEQRDNDVNYAHETIELPAVLVDCETWRIVDSFGTYVKPEINPKIHPFCEQLTHITQEMVDNAPIFPEAWSLLMQWMEKHGLMGGDENASFVVVTDGPNDIWHFLQRSFLQYHMKIPHEFRHFINIKYIFENNVERLTKGDGTTSLAKMCDRLTIPKETDHTGIGDAIMVAKIAIRLVKGENVTLYITHRVRLRKGRKPELPPPIAPEEVAKKLAKLRKSGQRASATTIAQGRLPYELIPVSKSEFETEEYWDCESCGEWI